MISSKRINLIGILLTAAVLILTVCAIIIPDTVTVSGRVTGIVEYSEEHSVNYTEDDYYSNYSESSVAKINLKGTSATSGSKNVKIDGGKITILGGGTYVISGELTDGSIIVDSADSTVVRLILNGAWVKSEDFSAIYVKQAEKTIISTIEGTENYLSDSSQYNEELSEDGMPGAALYSKDDLTLNGGGTLIVTGNYQDGIKVNDTLKITEGTLKVTAVDDGINTNDCISFLEAEIEVSSGGDAIKCEHENSEKGFIALEGTSLTVTSEGDGVYASSSIYANDITAQLQTGGGAGNAESGNGERMGRGMPGNQNSADETSKKGFKAGNELCINGGEYMLDTKDDALHSDGNINITGGNINISSGEDAVHADKNLVLAPEALYITKCYEGLEGAYITINDGDIKIISNDDGINAVGENSNNGFGGMMNMNGGTALTSEEDIYLTLNGGHIYVETSGDGFDSNGSAVINGGFLEIYGPENSGNGSIDVGDGGYVLMINGGKLLAAGSSGMAESPSESSAQQSLTFYLDETYSSDSTIIVADENGEEIISGTSAKQFNWICISSPDIITGKTYTLKINDIEIVAIEATEGSATSGSRNSQGNMGGKGRRK